jgi:hypothetical protein
MYVICDLFTLPTANYANLFTAIMQVIVRAVEQLLGIMQATSVYSASTQWGSLAAVLLKPIENSLVVLRLQLLYRI